MPIGQKSGRPSALGASIVAQCKADTERRRDERTERIKAVMAERLREIQSARQPRQKGRP
jgi:hypothetical protein